MSAGSSTLVRAHVAPPASAAAALLVGAAIVAAVAFGALTSSGTEDALMVMAAGVAIMAALFAPLGALGLLLLTVVLVPYPTQNEWALTGGTGEPGLLFVDLLLVLALLRVTVAHVRRRSLGRPMQLAYLLLIVAGLQLVHGVVGGASVGSAGTEARNVCAAIAGFLLAVPVLEDRARRDRLPAILLVLGLAVGAWGLAQWTLQMPFNGSDFGVREGRFGTDSGRAQLQGGLFLYPIAVVLAFAALTSRAIERRSVELLVGVALTANLFCLLVTYERTFWLAAVLGSLFVLARGSAAARRRAVVLVPIGLVALVGLLSVTSPTSLRTAVERGSSVSDVQSDDSGTYRVAESEAALDPISARPVDGSGFGAQITWEPPHFRGKIVTESFIHNGYLWLTWKAGFLFAALWVGVLALSLIRRPGVSNGSLPGVLRIGAQASLLGLLVVNVTFASFNALSVGAVTGLLVALCWLPRPRPAESLEDRLPGATDARPLAVA